MGNWEPSLSLKQNTEPFKVQTEETHQRKTILPTFLGSYRTLLPVFLLLAALRGDHTSQLGRWGDDPGKENLPSPVSADGEDEGNHSEGKTEGVLSPSLCSLSHGFLLWNFTLLNLGQVLCFVQFESLYEHRVKNCSLVNQFQSCEGVEAMSAFSSVAVKLKFWTWFCFCFLVLECCKYLCWYSSRVNLFSEKAHC